MIKKYLMKSVALLMLVSLIGCGANNTATTSTASAGEDEVVVLKFRDAMTDERIKELDGKKVQMTGFIATSSPLNGEFVYLMNMPYHQSPYCIPNTNILSNTLTAYSSKGKNFEFTDAPITITGTFVAGNSQDSFGYVSPYNLVNSSYEAADVNDLEGAIKEYSLLAGKGFITTFLESITEVYELGGYKELGTNEADLKEINTAKVKQIKKMFDGLDMTKYQDAYSAVEKLETLTEDMNKSLKNKEYSTLVNYKPKYEEVFNELNTWILKYSF